MQGLIYCPKTLEKELLHVFHEGLIEEDNTFKTIIQNILAKKSEHQKSSLKKILSLSQEIEKLTCKSQEIKNENYELKFKLTNIDEENRSLKEQLNDLKSGQVQKNLLKFLRKKKKKKEPKNGSFFEICSK